MAAERRSSPRADLQMLVQFRLQDIDEFMRDYAVNISAGGMFVRTEEPHSQGAIIYLQFRLVSGEKLFEGLAEVVHVNPPGHTDAGMGLEFVNLDPESRTLINQIVEERVAELED